MSWMELLFGKRITRLPVHKQTVIRLEDKDVEIDRELVPLILELNKIGLKTCSCCKGGDDFDPLHRAYISFDASKVWIDYSHGTVNLRWLINKEPWTRIDVHTKEECDNMDCFYCRYHMHNQRRVRCCKYEELHNEC